VTTYSHTSQKAQTLSSPQPPVTAAPVAPFAPVQALPQPATSPSNGIAITAMIFGIVGAVTGIWTIVPVTGYFSAAIAFPLLLTAVICGHIGQSRAKRLGGAGRWSALSGILLGYITLAYAVATSIAWTVFLFIGSI